jgi:GAF domain-containing protein
VPTPIKDDFEVGDEAPGLRALLRDLVALSAIPAVWVERAASGREAGTEAVATELAETLVALLELDFAFVRLSDPGGAGAADVARGGAWKRFPEWLEGHLGTRTQFTRQELVVDVGDGPQPCRGVAIPVGLDGEGGVVAAASERSDFPTATEQLLLALAANQAGTAFQSARLVHERRRAEEELRGARDELELNVAARTAELRRSEAYSAEAQRLTQTGSFAIDASTREVTHSSDETSRLYGFDPEQGTPSLSEFIQRIDPQDRAICAEALERGIHEATNIEVEYRVVLPHSPVRRHRAIAHPVFDASGELDEVVGTIVDVTERRQVETELGRLAGEQAALRRVATLIAREASQAEVFTAIAEEVGHLLGTDEIRMVRYEEDHSAVVVGSSGEARDVFQSGSRQPLGGVDASSRVFRTRQPVRIDDYGKASGPIAETARSIGIRGVVAAPVLVEGRLWGAMVAGTTQDEPLPAETESRLGQFTELMATAIANTESRARADRLADEQAALRRVAILVAKESPPEEVFAKVAEELANVLGDVDCSLFRDEGDGTASAVALCGATVSAGVRVGTRLPVDGESVIASVIREGRPCRIGDYSGARGAIAQRGRELGIRSAVGYPIVVGGRLWGAMGAANYEADALPPETETRIAQFADLVSTAIANAEARTEVERLADEQAALRRIATLVAQGVPPAEIFSAVSNEVGQLFGEHATVGRFDPDGPAHVVLGVTKGVGGDVAIGSRYELDDSMATMEVYGTGRSARRDSVDWSTASAPVGEPARRLCSVSTVSSPIVVEGRLWGAISVTAGEPLPLHVEERLEKFTGLVATAISNAESREALRQLADEQAALRRVATLVAEGASPAAVFDAVAGEMEALLEADQVALNRFEPGAEILVLAHRGLDVARTAVGTRVSTEGESETATVRRTGRPARMESYEGADGALAELARTTGLRSSVAAPIVVEGRLWGLITASWKSEQSPPADTEERMARFAELLDSAIANADSRAQLTASRARLLTEGDEARRRVVRDLHDGAQQRMVHTIMLLKLAQRALRAKDEEAESLVAESLKQAEQGNAELRELALGILPSVLTHGGLRAGVRTVVARLDLPVHFDVTTERFPEEIEASAYFIVAEALTNVVKHSHAGRAEVKTTVENGLLHVEVRDDGVGGADPDGHGLVGLGDRVTALGGRLEIESPAGAGTLVSATLPISAG